MWAWGFLSEKTPMSNEEKEEAVAEFTGSLGAIMESRLPKDGKALKQGPIFDREEITFRMSSDTCSPGIFSGSSGEIVEFKLTVVALTHQEEVEATRSVKAPTDLPFALAKKALYKFNGELLDDNKRSFLFEAIGPKGRQVALAAYGEVNSAGDEAMGKLHSEWEV